MVKNYCGYWNPERGSSDSLWYGCIVVSENMLKIISIMYEEKPGQFFCIGTFHILTTFKKHTHKAHKFYPFAQTYT